MDLGGCVNAFAGWLCDAPLVRGVAGSPFLTALVITALAAVVVLGTCGGAAGRREPKKARARAFVYVLLLVTGLQLVHHCAVQREACRDATAAGVQSVFSSLEAVRAVGGRDVPVYPGRRPAPPLQEEAPPPAKPEPARPAVGGGGGDRADRGRPDNVASAPLDLEDVHLAPRLLSRQG